MPTPEESVLTVSELTREIRSVLEQQIGSVWVEGEISNHRLQSSGHQYFTLKDAGAQLSCVMFRGASRSGVRLQDGVQVQLRGEISVYESRGHYQLVVKQVQLKGVGGLLARFEALKRQLHEEGLFDPEHKKPIPRLPRVVALVTSPTGAAIQDMIHILTRRAPWVRVIVYPVRVQGQGVERETIQALRVLNEAGRHGLPEPDTIVIGRGGGSIEDLWAYNEEALARAIYSSEIPVISAVGHEIDFTIADFVADLRAPTPSAAAELLAPDTNELRRHFEALRRRLDSQVRNRLDSEMQALDFLARGALKSAPGHRLREEEQTLDDLEARLASAPESHLRDSDADIHLLEKKLLRCQPQLRLTELDHHRQTRLAHLKHLIQSPLETRKQQVQQMAERLRLAVQAQMQQRQDKVAGLRQLLRSLGPQSVLDRGFSYTTDSQGRSLKKAAEVAPGTVLVTHLKTGRIWSTVQPPGAE